MNKEHYIYRDILEKGIRLKEKTQSVIDMYDHGQFPTDIFAEEKIVDDYYAWKKEIINSLLDLGNPIEASFFEEIDTVPSIEYLSKNNYIGSFDSPIFANLVYKEIENKLERIRNIAQKGQKKSISNFDMSVWVKKNDNGDYLFNGNIVDIKNKEAQYVIIFNVVYSLIPNGGKISYKDIIIGCKKYKIEVDKKSIQKALTGEKADFFRYVKIDRSPINGISLFRAIGKGKYLEFNNKKN